MKLCLKSLFTPKIDQLNRLKRGHVDKYIKTIQKHYQEIELQAFEKLSTDEDENIEEEAKSAGNSNGRDEEEAEYVENPNVDKRHLQ